MKTTHGARTVGGCRWAKAEGKEEEEGRDTGNSAGSRQGVRPKSKLVGYSMDIELDGVSETTEFQPEKKKIILRCFQLIYSGQESERKSS